MKRLPLLLAALGLLITNGSCRSQPGPRPAMPPDLLARWHFSGTEQLFAHTNAAHLKSVWELPESAAFRAASLQKLAAAPFGGTNQTAGRSPNLAALLRPLLDDVFRYETALDWRGSGPQPRELAFAIRLPAARVSQWQQNLAPLLKAWSGSEPLTLDAQGAAAGGLAPAASARTALGRMGDWFLVGWSAPGARLMVLEEYATGMRANQRPVAPLGADWFLADLNLDSLRKWLPPLPAYGHLPSVHLGMSNRADRVRTVMQMNFPGGHGWKPQPWLIPTNVIHEPNSFMAIRGLDLLLKPAAWPRDIGWAPIPQQAFTWSQESKPEQLFFAAPTDDPVATLRRLASPLRAYLATLGGNAAVTNFAFVTNRLGQTNFAGLAWPLQPFISPLLAAGKQGGQSYLRGWLSRAVLGTNPAPAALFHEVTGQPTLAYYNFEMTAQRIFSWRHLMNVTETLFNRRLTSPQLPGDVWLRRISKLETLGATITQVTAPSPNELLFERVSTIGFTGLELNLLERWLDITSLNEWAVFLPPYPKPPASLLEKSRRATNAPTVINVPKATPPQLQPVTPKPQPTKPLPPPAK